MAEQSVISDEAWAWMEPLLPDRTPRQGGRWRDHREVLEAIAWRYRCGVPWRELPRDRFGPWQSVYDRHVRWSKDGTYDRLLAAVHTAADEVPPVAWTVGHLAGAESQQGGTRRRDLSPAVPASGRLAFSTRQVAGLIGEVPALL